MKRVTKDEHHNRENTGKNMLQIHMIKTNLRKEQTGAIN